MNILYFYKKINLKEKLHFKQVILKINQKIFHKIQQVIQKNLMQYKVFEKLNNSTIIMLQ